MTQTMNDVLAERETCAKIVDKMPLRKIGSVFDYAGVIRETAAAIRARPAPKPVITDERIEKVAKAIYDLRHGEGAFEQEKSWRVSAGIEWRTSEPLFAEARAALVAALGGK